MMMSNLVDKIVSYNNPYLETQIKESFKLSDLKKDKVEVIEMLLELYQCRPKEEYFEMYAEDAIFEDPICNANNKHEIRVQFTLMPKLFPRSETTKFHILLYKENELVLDLFQWYYIAPFHIAIPIRSQVRLLFNKNGKITYHGDYWYHSAIFDKFKGVIGMTWNSLRRLNAIFLPYIAPLIVKLPKD